MIAIITGASSGIGREFAYQIDEMDFDEIWLVARRLDRLEEIKEKLKTPVKVLCLDLLDDESYMILEEELKKYHPNVDMLINSAGMGINDYFDNIDISKDEAMIKLNILAPTKLIKIISPYMIPDSVIINVASVAGFIPQPKFTTYSASKAYMVNFSRSLNREYRDRGINVSALCPNPVDTEFGQTNESGLKKYGTEDLSRLVKIALDRCRETDLITTHPASKFMLVISKIIPHSFIMWVEQKFGMY